MGACALLPRIIGFGRASELLYLGRTMGGEEAERWGFYNRLSAPEVVLSDATAIAATVSSDAGASLEAMASGAGAVPSCCSSVKVIVSPVVDSALRITKRRPSTSRRRLGEGGWIVETLAGGPLLR